MKTIRRGSKGKTVGLIQQKVGAVRDLIFGPETEKAVKRWQRAWNQAHPKSRPLAVDGIVGPLTYKAMFPVRSIFRRPADIIVLDIGHGMNNVTPNRLDPGADPKGAPQEHGDVKSIVYLLKTYLESRGRVVRIVRDVAVSQRDDIASRYKPYLFVSNHLNATPGGTGPEVLHKGGYSRMAKLAAQISAAIAEATGLRDRGAKAITRALAVFGLMPAKTILIEWYFVDSAKDRAAFAAHKAEAVLAVAKILDEA